MTIVVDLREEQEEELEEMAARRGEKEGVSILVREAVDLYLDRHKERETRVREALAVLGTLDEAAANEMEETVRQLRSSWR